jgi:hypothetical protein
MAKYGLPPPEQKKGPKKGSREEYMKYFKETTQNSAQLGELTRQIMAMGRTLKSIQEHHGIVSGGSLTTTVGRPSRGTSHGYV